jgi:alkylation response protein AidB-like acyl-CoA dehydrogenase
MTAVLNSRQPGTFLLDGAADLLAAVAARARILDGGEAQARVVLPELGSSALLGLGAPANVDGRLPAMAEVISALAERCMSSAFGLWAHRMAVEYLSAAGTPYAHSVLPTLSAGTTPGVTAMAAAFRELSGSGSMDVVARRDGEGWILDGPIRWASNLYPDAVMVTAARAEDGTRVVVALPLDTPGVRVAEPFALLALGSTASSSLLLDGARVPAEQVLSTDFEGFLRGVRATFLVLQTSFCAGLAAASLDAARSNGGGVNAVFAAEVEMMGARLRMVRTALADCARRVGTERPPIPAELLALRLSGAEVATGATALEAKLAGGRGYAVGSATARRLREAAFIPIQSPSEAQLRWELAACPR